MASLVAQMVKRLPAMRESWVQSLGREDALEKEMATHSSILAWKIPRLEEPGVTKRVTQDLATKQEIYISWSLSQKTVSRPLILLDSSFYSHCILKERTCISIQD